MENDNVNFGEQNSLQQSTFYKPQTQLDDTVQEEPNDSATDIDKKIKFWKKFSLVIGFITLFGYIFMLISTNVLAHEMEFGWVIFMLFGMAWLGVVPVLFVLSLISLIRVIVLSSRRKKHVFKDYITVIIGLLLIFSPYALSGVLSFFRISWNEDGGISVTLKSKDPYNLSGDSSWGAGKECAPDKRATSNDVKNNPPDYTNLVDDIEERKVKETEYYMEWIGREILCQVGEFYRENGRYPNESEIESFSSNAINDDIRNGIYNIKPEVGAEPNDKDFTVFFNRSCANKRAEDRNVVVLSPLYGADGRWCSYNDIDEILESF